MTAKTVKHGHSTAVGLQEFLKEARRKGAVNWVRIAIFQLGGPETAADRLGVTRQAVNVWLKRGVRGRPYREVERLALMSRIPIRLIGTTGAELERRVSREVGATAARRRVKP